MSLRITPFLPAIAWFIISLVLFTMSPTDLPDEKLFKIPQQDKLIHFSIFFILVYLFSRPLKSGSISNAKKASWFLSIALYGIVYGITVEFIQKYLVPNRSYEVWDIAADSAGCLAGYIFCRLTLLKKSI